MCSSPMKILFSVGTYGTKSYWSICFADKGFKYRGIWVCHCGNFRIIPFNRFFEKTD